MKLRICIIQEEGRFGGPANRIINNAKELLNYGIESTIVVPYLDSHEYSKRLNGTDINLTKMHLTRLSKHFPILIRYGLTLFFELFILYRFFKKNKFDLIHVNGSYQIKSAIAAKIAKFPVVWHVNDTFAPILIKKLFLTISSFCSNGFIFTGERTKFYYFKHTLLECPYEFIQPPVNIPSILSNEILFVPNKKTIKIGTISGFNPTKGLNHFVEVCAILNEKYSNLEFFIAGSVLKSQKRYYQKIINEIKNRGLQDKIKLLGFVEDIDGMLKMLDIVLLTSVTESGPTTAWEAMAMAKPLVTTDVGSVSEYIKNGKSGFIASVGNFEQLAHYVSILIDNPKLRTDFSMNAHEVAKHSLTTNVSAKKHYKIYRRVIEKYHCNLVRPRIIQKTDKDTTNYQICSRTVMDSSDGMSNFDGNGISSHYYDFHKNVKQHWHPDDHGRVYLERLAGRIKKEGENKDFDCILGLSGGLDSSYMLHTMVKDYGMRPLVFHVDGGWNSEESVNNINVLVDKLGIDLFTEVINWEEMRDFQLAWFKSGVPHIDIPQDLAFIAILYKFAEKHSIKYILNGGNISTECVKMPYHIYYWGTDMRHINHVIRQFGTISLNSYPFSSVFYHKLFLPYIKGIKMVKPLNYIPYTQKLAVKILEQEYGWKTYPQKHFESRFTKFFEGYWLPSRFGFDVRRNHFSSLILTGQISREEALLKLKTPPYDPDTIKHDFEYVATKLGISVNELRGYHEMPKKYYNDYYNSHIILSLIENTVTMLGMGRRGGAF